MKRSKTSLSLTRHEARRLTLQILYQVDLVATRPEVALARTLRTLEISAQDQELEYVHQLINGVLEHQEELDRYLGQYAQGWVVSRMAVVDRNLLRIALFELLYCPDVPAAAAVDEAVELAKEYGDTDSPRFINGILGTFVRDHPRPAGPVTPAPTPGQSTP
ncbi:MAG: transcription antitermination factor NusB [Limnochordaceae bacterium]|nr:transcription antitermination factor NusB [Limnochordaceae bacterium]